MIDLISLNTAIQTRLTTDPNLIALNINQFGYDFIPEGTTKPFVRYSIITDDLEGVYGRIHLTSLDYQFSTFSDISSVQAGQIQKALGISFDGHKLALSSGVMVSSRLLPGIKMMMEREDPRKLVYHSIVMIRFIVQN